VLVNSFFFQNLVFSLAFFTISQPISQNFIEKVNACSYDLMHSSQNLYPVNRISLEKSNTADWLGNFPLIQLKVNIVPTMFLL
jgi:hypothetical protein